MNYLPLVKKFKETNGSQFAQHTSEECLLIFLEFILHETNVINVSENHILTDNACFCEHYKKGDLMINCDGGCRYSA